MAAAHAIESLQFDVAFDSADEAFAQQGRLSHFAQGQALEVIGKVFDELSPPGSLRRFDRLEVKLPPLPLGEPDSAWAERLERGLRDALVEPAGAGSDPRGKGVSAVLPAGPAAGPLAALDEPSSPLPSPELASLWYWLHHGHLPWQVDGRPVAAVGRLWQGLSAEHAGWLAQAVALSPQRERLKQRMRRQGLLDGATRLRPAAPGREASPEALVAQQPAAPFARLARLAQLAQRTQRGHSAADPRAWVEGLATLPLAHWPLLADTLVPAPQRVEFDSLVGSLPWLALTRELRPVCSEAQARARLWACALSAAAALSPAGFERRHWLESTLRHWRTLVATDAAWALLHQRLADLETRATMPAGLRQGLCDVLESLRAETGPPATTMPNQAQATPPVAPRAVPQASTDAMARRMPAARADDRRAPAARAADEQDVDLDRHLDHGDGHDCDRDGDGDGDGDGDRDRDRDRDHRRRALDEALQHARPLDAAAAWWAVLRADRAWLVGRLRQQGVRRAWRQALAQSLDEAAFLALLRLWASDADVQRVRGLLAGAGHWSMASSRQPPSWSLLLKQWLLDHLLVGSDGPLDWPACLGHLLQQRARWEGVPVVDIAPALARGLFGAAGQRSGHPLPAADESERVAAALKLVDGAARRAPRIDAPAALPAAAGGNAPGVGPTDPSPPTPSSASTLEATLQVQGAAPDRMPLPSTDARIAALRAGFDAALAQADPAAMATAWTTLLREDRAWLAQRLQHQGRSAAWRARWAAWPAAPWVDLLGLWLAPGDVATVLACIGEPMSAAAQPASDAARRRRVLERLFAKGTTPTVSTDADAEVPAQAAADVEVELDARTVALTVANVESDSGVDVDGAAEPSTGSAATGDLSDWLRPLWPQVLAALPKPARPGSRLSLQHRLQVEALATRLASPTAAARQVDLLDEAGRRQLLHCLRPDAAAPALQALDRLVQARADAVATMSVGPGPSLPPARPRPDDWCFLLQELVEQDRPFDASAFARRWWQACAKGRDDHGSVGLAVVAAGGPFAGPDAPWTDARHRPGAVDRQALREALIRRAGPSAMLACAPSTALPGAAPWAPPANACSTSTTTAWSIAPSVLPLVQALLSGLADQADGRVAVLRSAAPPPWPDAPTPAPSPPWLLAMAPPVPALDATLYVHNAGLVLLGPYLPMLFSRIGLTDAQAFKDPAGAERALHLLQFLCDGSQQPAEHQLLLPKLLCGLDPALPVLRELALSDDEQAACLSLLEAVVAHWRALGKTSVAGLRETFLQREGALVLKDDEWSLTVENKTFDILIDQLPWGFATCRFPWMKKVLHVHWR